MDNKEQETILIEHKGAIARYMQEMAALHCALTISTVKEDRPRHYKTAVLKLDAQKRILILHQLMPADWRQVLHSNEVVKVSCNMPNGILRFSSALSPFEKLSDSPYCQLKFPRQLRKSQLRSFFRVSVIRQQAKISLALNGMNLNGKCIDISLGGGQGSFLLSSDELASLGGKDTTATCALEIPGIMALEVECKVCRTKPSRDNRVIVGFKFQELSSQQTQSLMRAIIKLERQHILEHQPLTAGSTP